MTRLIYLLRHFSRQLWVRAVAFAGLGILAAVVALAIGPMIPRETADSFGVDASAPILNILATSMLAVTTFSLSIMVSAYGSAAQAVTPRAVQLLLQDQTSQTVLSTFLGAFLFALIGLIAEEAGLYGTGGRVVLFLSTLAVVTLVVAAMLRWVGHLTTFGRLTDATERVETVTAKALTQRLERPFLGGMPLLQPPSGVVAIRTEMIEVVAGKTGYICHVDMHRLQAIASKFVADREKSRPVPATPIRVLAIPGAFVHDQTILLTLPSGVSDALAAEARDAFIVAPERTFDQDPRFGLCVLAEIAQRALSPAVNDPGTAIDILGRGVRLLSEWKNISPLPVEFPLVAVPPLALDDCMHDLFAPIARDGAANPAVQVRLQKSLLALVEMSPDRFAHSAVYQSQRALCEARGKLTFAEDIENIERIAESVAAIGQQTKKPLANVKRH